MTTIPLELKQRIARHLGYSRPKINPVAKLIFDENCRQIQANSDIYGRSGQSIIILVERCDDAFRGLDATDNVAFGQFQQILGDTNRSTRNLKASDLISIMWEYYLQCCDRLAKFLNVPNLQRTEVETKFLSSFGNTYLNAIPEIPDTCASDRIYFSLNYC